MLLVVGSKLGPVDTCGENPRLIDPARQTLIQIDIEPRNVNWTFPVAHSLIGDADTTLQELAKHLRSPSEERRQVAEQRVATAHQLGSFEREESTSGDSPVLPQRLVASLSSRLPAQSVVCCDAGENRLFMAHHYRTRAANGFIQPAGIGGMGFAIPAALGAKLASPDRLAVAVCGDGGFAMTMNGLLTSIEENLPILVVVLNNQLLGWVRHDQGERPIASQFRDFDYSAIARSTGCRGIAVSTPAELDAALDSAVIEAGRTTVLDVRIDASVTWKSVASSYVGEWKALVAP